MTKIIFDMDDTLWSLNKRICKHTGIPYEKIITFSIHENPLLTESERQTMLSYYGNTSMFENIKWIDNVERINDMIHDKNIDIFINSNSANDTCSAIKRRQLHEIFDMSDDHISINTTGNKKKNVVKKTIDDDTYIFVDDSPHNVAMSPAKYNIMIKTPWNQSDAGKTTVKDKNVIYCDDFNHVLQTIYKILDQKGE